MQSEEHRRQTLRTLEKAVEKDKTTSHVGGFSDLGLVHHLNIIQVNVIT